MELHIFCIKQSAWLDILCELEGLGAVTCMKNISSYLLGIKFPVIFPDRK